jgi:acetyl esterase/lipase
MKPARLLTLALLALALPLAAQQRGASSDAAPTPGTGTFSTTLGLEYATTARGDHLLVDMYVPDEPGIHPAILYLHTGAWITGDRDPGASLRQARRGYVVASIDYELAPRSIYPAQLEDCKAAVRWLRANAARFRIDPERIAVFGASAGGHLAALLGTTGGITDFEGEALGNAGFSSRVKAVVDFYGPTDLLLLDSEKAPCAPPLDGNSPFLPPSLLIGCPIQECKEKTERANPINFITADDPPFLILHGDTDCLVPWQQSKLLYDALIAARITASFYLIPGAGHADAHFDELQNQQIVSDFFDKYLRGSETTVRRHAAKR